MKYRLVFVSADHPEPSASAAALAAGLAGDKWDIHYACNAPREINPMVGSILQDRGIALPGKPLGTIEDLKFEQFDVVVTFCARSRGACPTFAGLPAHFH